MDSLCPKCKGALQEARCVGCGTALTHQFHGVNQQFDEMAFQKQARE